MHRTIEVSGLVGGLLVALSASGGAQQHERSPVRGEHQLVVVARDTAGTPVALAEVRITAGGGWVRAAQTGGDGRSVFSAVPAGEARIQIRRLGFLPSAKVLMIASSSERDSSSAQFVLQSAAAELSGIEVMDSAPDRDPALIGFYARRGSNLFGHYLDRTDLDATHAQRPSEALRGVPGLVIQPSRRVGNTVRFRNCRPTVWLDGVRLPDSELDEVSSFQDISAIEIYKSLAGLPQQFVDRSNPCGGILVWSRNH